MLAQALCRSRKSVYLRPVWKNGWAPLRRGERAFYFLGLQCGASHAAAAEGDERGLC